MSPIDSYKSYVYTVEQLAGNRPTSKVSITYAISRVAFDIKDLKPPSISTVRRWHKNYLQHGLFHVVNIYGGGRCNH